MPLLSVTTNHAISDEAATLLLPALSKAVSDVLAKPEQYVMITCQHNPLMLFAGSSAPLAYVELKSIGLPTDRTREISATLTDALHANLGIAPDRIYIEFSDAQRHLFGWNGRTFAD